MLLFSSKNYGLKICYFIYTNNKQKPALGLLITIQNPVMNTSDKTLESQTQNSDKYQEKTSNGTFEY